MKKSFNLIDKEAKQAVLLLKLKRKVKLFAFSLVGVFIVVLILVMGVLLLTKNSIQASQRKKILIENEIKSLANIETLAAVTAGRIKMINTILQERKSYSPLIADIESISVTGFRIDGLDILADGTIKISGTCDSLESLTNFNNQVEELSRLKKYSQIVYPSVGRNKDGKYNLSLELKP
ncbi:hypothetical protein COS54_03090 [Candidatus Shapirobacteria bacterium CG03_land_8_20_14_0_80_39_12]|uniref:PilN domain-containing protein n=1 Tax=Candidatus Shapirobacteria bacterium CG03_land_8_20_14_0_80_39_12 TaxID=1974879 RepID=A0A2M7BBG9_9BACT|nr:MAG: hypothetical protein COS54_03090 [Candidatus Shapirobacteria bacterium CG03_land_8_20_14_0_80_39_12]